ncbi:dynein axonemal assembly factor 5 isoform X1 [Parasteatoda tepidariorum]|uniref:dynein axonemal assembly factor 5 isoform X1 n=1 Tax=Parasteatoda tepidariorum TaxID=114398 RepID=UPI00077FAC53|nr:dynein axonemal assembly factor 5 isoform X1 [Parasteatoda tepidariorum]
MAEQTVNTDENLVKCLTDCCENYFTLKKGDALSRRNALKEIHNYILILKPDSFQESNLNSLLDSLSQSLTSSLSDGSEKCRELSVAILKIIFSRFSICSESLSSLFKALANRLGKTDEREQSEEIRILEIELINEVIERTNCSLLLNLNDIASIISACIVDECPEMKRKGCECLSLLAFKESQFHMIGGTFLTPLLGTITHQHMKTRVLCIKALGKIVDYLNCEEFEKAISYLAQRLFDHSPAVRLAATEVVGSMMLELKDRYSYFPRLIPIILSTLYDEVLEVRSKGKELWHKSGNQYLKENDKDYKDLIDFPQETPKNYPNAEDRPPVGCRILVQRNSYKIFPPLLTELSDWLADTRIKCSKVLYSIILHSEEKITSQLTAAVDGIAFSAKDESKECVEMAIKAAELLGYFVDPNLLCDTIMTLIHKTPSSSNLRIFAASIQGCSSEYSVECFQEILKFLASSSISRLRKADEQTHLLLCVEALLSSGNKIDHNCSEFIFTILLSVAGLSKIDTIIQKAEELLVKLAVVQSYTVPSLFEKHLLPFLKSLTSNYELWNLQSPEMPIFNYLLLSDHLYPEAIKTVIPVFLNNLHPSKDARVRSIILSLISPTLNCLSPTECEGMSEDILTLIRSGIFPNLTWMAGKTASKLRTLAAASLFEIVGKSSNPALVKHLGDEILPILATLADDDETTTRLLSCKILESILPLVNDCIDDQKIHNTCFQLLRCMDDESDDVRIMTVRVLKAYVKSFPSDYDWNMYKAHVKSIYENVLIHMDDKNEKIRQSVLNLLKDIGFAAPDVLLDEVESKRYVMSANDLCDNLIAHIKNIKV